MPLGTSSAPITRIDAEALTIPTDAPEADGTLTWDSTTIVLVEAWAGDRVGLGYAYTHESAASVVASVLAPCVRQSDALDIERCYVAMRRAVRNVGRDGIAASAISAVDCALWDLKARLLRVPLVRLLGGVRDEIPVYGSGGFTSYPTDTLCAQLAGWVDQGIGAVKMKIGPDAGLDRERVAAAREAIGDDAELFVDANGAYDRKVALAQASYFPEHRVSWFEEPVSSDDLEGLSLLRNRTPDGMEIAAGEYGYDLQYFRRMLEAGSVDVLQIDATRCGGITGFLRAAALADAFGLPLSAHTAPNLHAHVCCATPRARHVEYFHDHARIEAMLFDGGLEPIDGVLRPDRSRDGTGLAIKPAERSRFSRVGHHAFAG